jgi:hypothetical protein
MTDRLHHALEIHSGSATLYLKGHLSGADTFRLRRVCREIPMHVRTLRLDLHGVTGLEDGAASTLRALVRYWRESRNGCFRFSFASEHLVATMLEREAPAARPSPLELIGDRAALTGMFL